ncbi:MAG: class I poly(R)-hydroxyalkanoic acid synthase [Betaproteobacteria bacterium]|nr:MAG: class I poly(R)-hydroxyalkanoic acid synthase [Betaproteobacteria bacterium]
MVIPTSSSAEQFTLAAQALLRNFLGSLGVPPDSEFARSLQSVGVDSAKFAALQGRYLQLHAALWQSALTREAGRDATPIAPPDRGDRRFSSAEWQRIPWFDYLRQSYLINSRFLSDWIEALEAEPRAKERLRFIARQFSDAMSPANFAATNPEALRLALETKGESLTQGIRQLLEDVHKGRISTTDESVFEVGKNLAVTEGAVVFENELIQLIQYKPVTPTVFKQPLVMFPPCINKYYILDLQPENSLVRYAVEQGHPVFMVSWRNITEELGHLTWDDYVEIGVLKALEVARAICAAEKVNALGFCVGGTMLGAGLAVMAARGDNRVESATFLASMLDFADTGEIGLFVDESSAAVREAAIGKGGIMPGRDLALVFSALRANDLVWSYVVNNYLKGKSPEAFDLLYWNADSTNLPGPMYCWYVRNTYLENRLREPGKAVVLGVPVDLGKITVPAYVLATREDHIVPWHTAYRTTQLLGGEMRFVLGASGHVAGIINPVSKNKRSHWLGAKLAADPEEWLAGATEKPGSWWTDWSTWIEGFGGERVKARTRLGNTKFKPIEAAPGRYVKHRIV